ncbi:MAG: tetratricopeptide repeat protein [Candidatus Zixiibacteriota bacterium]
MFEKRKSNFLSLMFLTAVLSASLVAPATLLAEPEKAKEHFNAGLSAEKAGNEAGAITSYEAAIGEDAGFVDAYINLGAIYFRQKQFDKALQNFKTATEKDKKNADAFANLGRVQYALKKYAEAEIALKEAIALKGGDAEYYKDLGKVYYRKQNNEELIAALSKCHQLGGGDNLTYYMLGKAYEDTGNMDQAINALKKSAELDPKYDNAHSAIGAIYLSQEKYNSAAGAFKSALNVDPNNYRAAFNYAVAVESGNPENFDANIANWENFIRIGSKNPKAKNDVAVAKEHVKELKAAKEKANLQ